MLPSRMATVGGMIYDRLFFIVVVLPWLVSPLTS